MANCKTNAIWFINHKEAESGLCLFILYLIYLPYKSSIIKKVIAI